MTRAIRLMVACALLVVLVRPATALDAVERAVIEHIDSRRSAALELLERSVNQNSGTLNFQGVKAVGEIFASEFRDIGLATRWVEGAEFGRAGHLIAEIDGSGPHFLLIGHLDTVFEPESPFQKFERIDEHHALAPGSSDMKGGNVIILEILRALQAAGALESMRVSVILSGDEESSGRPLELARRDLIELARSADYALGFEDGDGDPTTAVIARRGAISWTLKTSGRPAHSSQVFSDKVGFGAIYEATRILESWRSALSGEELLTFNPGRIVGGTEIEHLPEQQRGSAFGKANVVAAECIVTGDLRSISPQQLSAAQEKMRRIAEDSLPHCQAELAFATGYPPLAPTDGNRRLLKFYDEVSQDLGFGSVEAVDPARAGAADISFCSGLVDGALCGLGLMGTGGHTNEETADLRTLTSQAKRAALLLLRLRNAE